MTKRSCKDKVRKLGTDLKHINTEKGLNYKVKLATLQSDTDMIGAYLTTILIDGPTAANRRDTEPALGKQKEITYTRELGRPLRNILRYKTNEQMGTNLKLKKCCENVMKTRKCRWLTFLYNSDEL
jgi:hypothetical protein